METTEGSKLESPSKGFVISRNFKTEFIIGQILIKYKFIELVVEELVFENKFKY